jgi:UDP-N-acetylmuramate-alanine ligase
VVQVVGFDRSAPWRIYPINAGPGGSSVRLDYDDRLVGMFAVPAPGHHLVIAAACAAVTGILLGATAREVRDGLGTFVLPQRRMSVIADADGIRVIDDNARHPAQVTALTQALRQAWPDSVVHLLVSPWGKRNARDLPAWAGGLSTADAVWVMPVGECATTAGGAEDPMAAEILASLIRQHGRPAHSDVTPERFAEAIAADRAAGRPVVVAGVGYDANTAAFTPFTQALNLPRR